MLIMVHTHINNIGIGFVSSRVTISTNFIPFPAENPSTSVPDRLFFYLKKLFDIFKEIFGN